MKRYPFVKLFTEARTDAKLAALPDEVFRVWFKLFCYASDQESRGAISRPAHLVAVECSNGDETLLKRSCNAMGALQLVTCDFSDPENVTIVFTKFDDWQQPQKPSDAPASVTARVRKHRAKSRATKGKGLDHDTRVPPAGADETRGNAGVTRYETPRNAQEEELEEEKEEERNTPQTPRGVGAGPGAPGGVTPGAANDPAEVARVAALAERLFPLLDYGPKVHQLATSLRADWLDAALHAAHASGHSRWKYVLGCYRRIAEDGGPEPPRRPDAAPARTMAEELAAAERVKHLILGGKGGPS